MAHDYEFSDRSSYISAHSWKSGAKKQYFFSGQPYFKHNPSCVSSEHPGNGIIVTQHDAQLYATRDLLEQLRHDGFIRHYGEGAIFNDYPKFHYVGINFIVDNLSSDETQLAWGYCLPDGDVTVAFSKALGECLERQASYYLPNLSATRFPKVKRGDASFLFPLVPHFTKEQRVRIKSVVQSEDDLKDCLGFEAKSLTSDRKRFFPFETFYWGNLIRPEQKLMFHHTSSGSGGGLSREQALVSGWYELIERDHFLLYWFSGIAPRQIHSTTLPGKLREYVKRMAQDYHLEVYFLDLHYDFDIIVGACVIIDPVLNKIAMGAKAGINAELVLESSLLEALAVISATRSQGKPVSEEDLRTILKAPLFTKIIRHADRVNLYASAYGINRIRESFLSGACVDFTVFNSAPSDITSSYRDQLDNLISIFTKKAKRENPGYHAYCHEYSSVWLDKLNYHAAHVFIPSLLKLHLNETLATPVSERLTTFAKENGKPDFTDAHINPLPHFFP